MTPSTSRFKKLTKKKEFLLNKIIFIARDYRWLEVVRVYQDHVLNSFSQRLLQHQLIRWIKLMHQRPREHR
jgi:hypothetical protein